MTSRLGIEVRDDRVDWAVLHRTLRGPMHVAGGSVPAAVGVDEAGRLVAGPPAGHPAVRDRVDHLPGQLGDPEPLILGGVPYGAERLLAVVVAAAVAEATRAAGDAPLHTVLVHPDGLDQLHRDLLIETARRAAIAAGSSLATVAEASAAASRTTVQGHGPATAIGGAQLAWERRPDDDHLGAAAGAAGGAALLGGAAVLGTEGAVASASAVAAGPAGVPLTPSAAGPAGTPLAPSTAGPAGTPLAPSTPGPAGAPLNPAAPGPAGTPLNPATPGPAGAPLPASGPPTEVPVVSADHGTRHRKRFRLRSRGRVLVATGAAVAVIGAGIAIVATAGDDQPAARVTSAQEGVPAGPDAATGVATATTSPPVVTLPAGSESTLPGTTTPGATAPGSTTPLATTAATAAPAAPAMPGDAGTCPVGTWRLEDQSVITLISDAFGMEGESGSVTFVGGSMIVVIGADGGWSTTWNDWSWQFTGPDIGTAGISWDGTSVGSVVVGATTIDIAETSSSITTTLSGPASMSIPGNSAFNGSATYTCSGGTLSMQFPENTGPFVMVPAS